MDQLVFLNLKKTNNKQSLRKFPGAQNKPGNVKCNKTITALHFVQYDVLWSTENNIDRGLLITTLVSYLI